MTRPTVLVYHADRRYAELVRVPKRGVNVRIAATPSEAAGAIADAEILYAWKFPPHLYAKAGRVTLLCGCPDEARCHRSLLRAYLLD